MFGLFSLGQSWLARSDRTKSLRRGDQGPEKGVGRMRKRGGEDERRVRYDDYDKGVLVRRVAGRLQAFVAAEWHGEG